MTKFIQKYFFYLFQKPIYQLRLGKLGSGTRLVAPIFGSPKNIFIGTNTFIEKNAWLVASPIYKEANSKLQIGNGCYIGHYAHIYATKEIIIEDNVLIANKIYISDNLHEYENIVLPVIQQPIKQLNTVTISSGAWLGENVCIIGASIGKNSIVGANSVVTKDIPDYCVAVGSPAKVIKKYNFDTKQWEKVLD